MKEKEDTREDYYPGAGVPQEEPPKEKKPIYKQWWFWVIIAWLGLGLIVSFTEDDSAGNSSETQAVERESVLSFLNEFTQYGYSKEQIANMKTVLVNVGITEITDLDIGNVVSGMQVVKGVIYKDPVYQYTGKEVQVQFNIENGVIYLVSIYCPSYNTSNQPTYLSGLTNRRADLYYDAEGGYLKKIDWEKKAVVDY